MENGGDIHLRIRWSGYGLSVLLVALATALGWVLNWQDAQANVTMIYLMCVVYAATTQGRGPAVFASVLSVAAYDFFFVPPYLAFTPGETKYLFTLAAMLVVALLLSELSARAREQAVLAQEKATTTDAQYRLSCDLLSTRAVNELLSVAAHHIGEVFRCRVAVLLPKDGGARVFLAVSDPPMELGSPEIDAAQDAFDRKETVRAKANGDDKSSGLYLPLVSAQKTVGVVGLFRDDEEMVLDSSQTNLMLALANHTAVAVERALLVKASEDANLRAERERLRSALLSSVSHDLRTPLSSITGAASSLLESRDAMSPDTVKELIQSIYDEADRLNRFVGNLLDMTRLQSGIFSLKKDWYSLEEVVGAAITRTEKRLQQHKVVTDLPHDLPLIKIDPTLMQQLFINLFDNAHRYSNPGSEIRVSASATAEEFSIEVFNSGSQLPDGAEEKIFEKFYRGRQTLSGRGVGLGLAICQAVVQAHGGEIRAENLPQRGVKFVINLPIEEEAPQIDAILEK